MATKVRDIVATGDGFQGSLEAALGCTEGRRKPGEFEVWPHDDKMRFVCKEHLALTVREDLVRTGNAVIVNDSGDRDPCEYVGPQPG